MYALQIEKLEWDSKIFGFGVGKIFNIFLNQEKYVPSAMDFLIKSSIKKLKKMKVNRIICRIPAVDFNTLKILEDNGFRTYENLITFARQLNNIPPLALSKDLEISNFKREDINEILKISYNTPTSSHFFNDPRFPNKKVKKFYREWTRNSCNSFANNVIVCRQNKKVVGFITLKIMTDFSIKYGIIDLVRVKEKYTGLGIGTGLVYAALRWFKDNNMNKVIVGTESTNIPAMRLYENTGFRTIFSEFTLHY
jgi:dTDP-4-amino-4,6-dideoxy-D-galactose acyltransferase